MEEITNNIRFPGQFFDEESGLYYNFHRYYSPVIGRYISADPVGLFGGINLYAYVGGNPLNSVDPNGLMNPDLLCPPNWEYSGGDCWPKVDPGGCPSGEFSDPFGGGCGRTDTEWPWNNPPEKDKGIYCGTISRAISVCSDAITVGSVIATVNTGGVTTPGTAIVAATARVISVSNGLITLALCGPSLSSATTGAGAIPGPLWWGALTAAADASLSLLGL